MTAFDDIIAAALERKVERVTFNLNGRELVFTANEVSYLERLHLSRIQHAGGEAFSYLLMYSIRDADGNAMTLEQIHKLPSEYAEKFFLAATKVNSGETKTEKN